MGEGEKGRIGEWENKKLALCRSPCVVCRAPLLVNDGALL